MTTNTHLHFTNSRGASETVQVGWNWFAFLLPAGWALSHQLWKIVGFYAAGFAAVVGAYALGPAPMVIANTLFWIGYVISMFVFGMGGNDMRRLDLEARGFRPVRTDTGLMPTGSLGAKASPWPSSVTAPRKAAPDSLLTRWWNGHLKLWQACWLLGVAGQLVALIILIVFTEFLKKSPALGALFYGVNVLAFIAYAVFASVAIWRSAGGGPAKLDGPSAMGSLARVAVIFYWMGLARLVYVLHEHGPL